MKKKLQNFKEFLTTATRGRTITFLIVILLIATLPVVIGAVQTNTENRQHAMVVGGGSDGGSSGTSCTVGYIAQPYCCGQYQGQIGYKCQGYQNANCTITVKQLSGGPYASCNDSGTTCRNNGGGCVSTSSQGIPSNCVQVKSFYNWSCGYMSNGACCLIATPTPIGALCTVAKGICGTGSSQGSTCPSGYIGGTTIQNLSCGTTSPNIICCVPNPSSGGGGSTSTGGSGGSGGGGSTGGGTGGSSPTTTTTTTITAPITPSSTHSYLNLAVLLPGLGAQGNGNTNFHTGNTRKMTISIYSKDANVHDVTTQPLIPPLKNIVITYNSNNGFFTNASIDLGTGLADNDYQVLVKVPQFLRNRITLSGTTDTTIHLVPGQIIATQVTLVPGDVAPIFNVLDIQDYNALVSCYNKNVTSDPACSMEDINDDGQIDLVDLNLFLRGMRMLNDIGSTTYQGEGAPGE